MYQYILVDSDQMELVYDVLFDSEDDAYYALDEYFTENWHGVIGSKDMYEVIEIDVYESGNPTPNYNWDYACIDRDYDGAEECNCPIGYGNTPINAVKEYLNRRIESM